jgi:hypothetical protein
MIDLLLTIVVPATVMIAVAVDLAALAAWVRTRF